ncbi:MAG TPA: hypothetical protein VLC98_08270 [Phnomibacter sp.]|nr:hypothetical protein [Phnomibacter sp.]
MTLALVTSVQVYSQMSMRTILTEKFGSASYSYSTNNYQPKAGALILAVVTSSYGSSWSSLNNNAAPDSVKANGLTWTKVQTQPFSNDAQRVTVYRAVTGGVPTNTAFSVYFPSAAGSEKPKNCIVQLIEILGAKLTGYNGSEAIPAIAQNAASGNMVATSVTDITTPGTAMFGVFACNQAFSSAAVTIKPGWNILSSVATNSTIDASAHVICALNSYDKLAQFNLQFSAQYGVLLLKLEPADYIFNFPCSGITTATNNQNFNLYTPQTVCISGYANGINVTLNNDAATFVVKSGGPDLQNVNLWNPSVLLVEQDATPIFTTELTINSGGNFIVSNGADVTMKKGITVNNGSINVYGNLTVNGDLILRNGTSLYVGNTAKLTVTGTINVEGAKVLLNGGSTKVKTIVTNTGAKVEMSGGAIMEANVFNTNWQANSFVTGPGGGCLGIVGSKGEIANVNNGFAKITASSDLKICLAPSGVTIGNYFNSNIGAAQVSYNCSGCAILLGGPSLPITLSSFDGSMLSTGVSQLAWNVANNNDVSKFTVEYSTNGNRFEAVGTLQKSSSNHYQFHHTSTHNGLIYYRLQITDKQGHSTYSRIITMLHGKEENTRFISMSPTVTTGIVYETLYVVTSQYITYSIVDAAGRQLKAEKKKVEKGLQQLPIDVQHLPQGLLFIQLQTQDGKNCTRKILKI